MERASALSLYWWRNMSYWTIQLGKWRKAKAQGIEVIDISRKSGISAFAPSPSLLATWRVIKLQMHDGDPDNQRAYTERYMAEMRLSWVENRSIWVDLIERVISGETEMAFSCYCGADSFCHRKIFINILDRLIDYYIKANKLVVVKPIYLGELK